LFSSLFYYLGFYFYLSSFLLSIGIVDGDVFGFNFSYDFFSFSISSDFFSAVFI